MTQKFDISIIGAGPAGLCLARSLAQAGFSIALIEKQPQSALEQPAADGRDIALTHASKAMLSTLGMWEHIPAEAVSIIKEARVFDGTSSRYMGLSSPDAEKLAFIVSNHHIRYAAYAAVRHEERITWLDNVSVRGIALRDSCAEVTLSTGECIRSSLLCAADSRFSESRRAAGIAASMHDFGKSMVVCQMAHELAHGNVAHECFHHGHTLAVLPLNGNRSSVIITMPPLEAARMAQLPPQEFNAWASEQFQHRQGTMRLDSECFLYPLVGVYADRFVAKRFALIGDAAVGMHPVTAHGFNFGLKSVQSLTGFIRSERANGGDIGSDSVLSRYDQAHRRATRPLYLATSGIVSLYTNDSAPAKLARSVLLHAAEHMHPVKSLLMAKLTEQEASPLARVVPSPLAVAKRLLKLAA